MYLCFISFAGLGTTPPIHYERAVGPFWGRKLNYFSGLSANISSFLCGDFTSTRHS